MLFLLPSLVFSLHVHGMRNARSWNCHSCLTIGLAGEYLLHPGRNDLEANWISQILRSLALHDLAHAWESSGELSGECRMGQWTTPSVMKSVATRSSYVQQAAGRQSTLRQRH